jgi:hypothetical protein
MLGDYQDPALSTLMPPANHEATLAAALEEYGQKARYPHPDGPGRRAGDHLS